MPLELHTQQNLPLPPVTQASLSHPTEKENYVLNVREAARLLRVHPDKLTDLARRGLIPAGVVGSRWRFSRLALLAHLSKPQNGPIKPTRRLVDFHPAKLIVRVQKLGASWL